MAHKDKVKALIGGGLNAYHQGVKNQINRINKENLKQNHVINVLSQDLTKDYITKTEESNYIDLDHSKEGMIFLDKISGKSLKNLVPAPSKRTNVLIDNQHYRSILANADTIESGKTYTLIYNHTIKESTYNKKLYSSIVIFFEDGTHQEIAVFSGDPQIIIVKEKPITKVEYRYGRGEVHHTTTMDFNLLCLEGDYRLNAPNEHFEGIASVGSEVENIEVKSIKADGNLFDGCFKKGMYSTSNGSYIDVNYSMCNVNPIKINGDIFINFEKSVIPGINSDMILEYDNNMNFIKYTPLTIGSITLDVKTEYINFRFYTNDNSFNYPLDNVRNLIISRHNIPYKPYTEDKKPILFRDTDGSWKPISELKGFIEVCDTIELHDDGKYYYHIRIAEKTFNGADNEDWRRLGSLDTNNTERYAIYVDNVFLNSNGLCDKIPYIRTGGSDSRTCIYVHNTDKRIDLRKLKTDDRWSDVATLKNWLKANNLTIIYQLAEEIVFEVDPITLICYANSALLTNTNIAPTITARYSGQAPALVKARKTKALSKVNSVDIEENIVPYLMDMDYRVAILQLNSEQTVAAYKSLGNTFDMLKRDILTNRYSKEEYLNRIEVYLNINRITQEEYEKLGELLNG